MWFRYNPQIIFYHFFCKLNLVIFQALLLSTYVNSMYLVRVTPLMNFNFSHGLKICMWFRYNPQIIFYHFICKLNLVIFQALLLSTYVNSMYLVRVTPLMNLTFSDDSLFLKKNLGGGHKFSEFACWIFFILEGYKANYKSLDEFEFRQNSTADFGVSCP